MDGVENWHGEGALAAEAFTALAFDASPGVEGQAAIVHQGLHHGLDPGHAGLHCQVRDAGVARPPLGCLGSG